MGRRSSPYRCLSTAYRPEQHGGTDRDAHPGPRLPQTKLREQPPDATTPIKTMINVP
jgi:hypothetical protein